MGRMTQRRRVTRITRQEDAAPSVRERSDVLAGEEPMEMRLNGESFSVTMRTPGHDFELVAGFLVAEGLVGSSPGQSHLSTLRYCAGTDEEGNQTYNVIDAQLEGGDLIGVGRRRQVVTTSACGICGTTSIDAVEKSLPTQAETAPLEMSAETLLGLPDALRQRQQVFESTGGVHAAGLFDAQGELLCLREDVGRHNAVDKVVGWAYLQEKLPLRGTVLQVSGRASFELVQKAALAGIEVLSAVGAPSSLAADLGDRSGVTVAGFSRGRSINIYTHQHRIAV